MEGREYADARRVMLKMWSLKVKSLLQINDETQSVCSLPWTVKGAIYVIEFLSYIISQVCT